MTTAHYLRYNLDTTSFGKPSSQFSSSSFHSHPHLISSSLLPKLRALTAATEIIMLHCKCLSPLQTGSFLSEENLSFFSVFQVPILVHDTTSVHVCKKMLKMGRKQGKETHKGYFWMPLSHWGLQCREKPLYSFCLICYKRRECINDSMWWNHWILSEVFPSVHA